MVSRTARAVAARRSFAPCLHICACISAVYREHACGKCKCIPSNRIPASRGFGEPTIGRERRRLYICVKLCPATGLVRYSKFLLDCPVRFAPYILVVNISKTWPKHICYCGKTVRCIWPADPKNLEWTWKNRDIWSQNRDVT